MPMSNLIKQFLRHPLDTIEELATLSDEELRARSGGYLPRTGPGGRLFLRIATPATAKMCELVELLLRDKPSTNEMFELLALLDNADRTIERQKTHINLLELQREELFDSQARMHEAWAGLGQQLTELGQLVADFDPKHASTSSSTSSARPTPATATEPMPMWMFGLASGIADFFSQDTLDQYAVRTDFAVLEQTLAAAQDIAKDVGTSKNARAEWSLVAFELARAVVEERVKLRELITSGRISPRGQADVKMIVDSADATRTEAEQRADSQLEAPTEALERGSRAHPSQNVGILVDQELLGRRKAGPEIAGPETSRQARADRARRRNTEARRRAKR